MLQFPQMGVFKKLGFCGPRCTTLHNLAQLLQGNNTGTSQPFTGQQTCLRPPRRCCRACLAGVARAHRRGSGTTCSPSARRYQCLRLRLRLRLRRPRQRQRDTRTRPRLHGQQAMQREHNSGYVAFGLTARSVAADGSLTAEAAHAAADVHVTHGRLGCAVQQRTRH